MLEVQRFLNHFSTDQGINIMSWKLIADILSPLGGTPKAGSSQDLLIQADVSMCVLAVTPPLHQSVWLSFALVIHILTDQTPSLGLPHSTSAYRVLGLLDVQCNGISGGRATSQGHLTAIDAAISDDLERTTLLFWLGVMTWTRLTRILR
jgi:hypothetical protein